MNVCPVSRTGGGHERRKADGEAGNAHFREGCGIPVAVLGRAVPVTHLLAVGACIRRQGRRRTPSQPRESSVPPEGAMTSPDLVRRFLKNAGNVAAGTHAVSDATDLRRVLSEIVPGTDPVFCPGLTDKEKAAAPSLPCRAADYAG